MILLLDDAVVPASRHQCVQSYVIYACFDCSSLLPLFASDSRPSGASSTRSGTPHGASCLQHPTDRRGHLPDQTLTTNRYFRALSSQFHLSFCTPTTNAEFAFAPQKKETEKSKLVSYPSHHSFCHFAPENRPNYARQNCIPSGADKALP